MKLFYSLFFLLTFLCADKLVIEANIDLYKKQIDKKYRAEKLIKKEYPNMSHLGGAVSGYYFENKLVLIKTRYNGEAGFHAFEYYIRNDSLLFVTEVEKSYKEFQSEEGYAEYAKHHTDRHGNINLSKLTAITTLDNYYYMSDTLITEMHMQGFRKSRAATEEEITEKNKMLLEHYRSHLHELKQ